MRRLFAAAALIAALTGLAWGGLQWWQASRRPTSVLLISVDTLRADRLGSYGYAAARTPHMDALAARGLRFAQATTVVPRPSTVSPVSTQSSTTRHTLSEL